MQLNEQPLILSLETATRAGSLALLRGSEVLDTSIGDEQSSQSNVLLQQLDNLLKKNACSLRDVEFIIAALGPGSFTGLRIGLARSNHWRRRSRYLVWAKPSPPPQADQSAPSPRFRQDAGKSSRNFFLLMPKTKSFHSTSRCTLRP